MFPGLRVRVHERMHGRIHERACACKQSCLRIACFENLPRRLVHTPGNPQAVRAPGPRQRGRRARPRRPLSRDPGQTGLGRGGGGGGMRGVVSYLW